jgi:Tfp pilus assembly protein FimT
MKAFSLIELIIVIAIIMIIGVTATTFGAGTMLSNNLEVDKRMLVSSLQKARSYAMVKKSNLAWGVCYTGGMIRVFGGSCASPTIKDDYSLSSSTVISGLSTVIFSNLRGEPDATQSITLTGNNKTITVSVNALGGIQIN